MLKTFDPSKTEFISYGVQYSPGEFNRARQDSKHPTRNKPYGGLWASPSDSKWGWKEWCEQNWPENGRNWDIFTKFHVNSKAKILLIDDLSDYEEILKHYGTQVFSWHPVINYSKLIADGWDGLFLTARGEIACHDTSLYGWDCESLVLFDNKYVEVI